MERENSWCRNRELIPLMEIYLSWLGEEKYDK